MSQPLAQPPKNEDRSFNDWMYRLWRRLTSVGGLPWNVVDKTGANITDIPTRHHDDLQYIPSNPVFFPEDDKENDLFIPPPQTYDFDHVTFPGKYSLGAMAHVYTLQELMNHEWSAGVVDGAVLTDNGNGTISLSSATSVLRASTDPHTTLYGVVTPAQLNIALTDNATNYVYIDWNAGSPTFNVSTSVTSFNCLDKCIAYVVHRNGTLLHWIDAREQNVDGNRKTRQLFLKYSRFIHAAGGTVLGSSGLAVTLTAGTFYFMLQQLDHIAFDTSVAGTANANVFALWYRNGVGGWTQVANSKVIDTTTYDNNTGTPVLLGNNKFGVTWFYVINDSPSELHAVMGEAQYASLADAAIATPPASVPTIIDGLGSLVGYVAYQKSNTIFDAVYSAFTQVFGASAATTHNGLAGLQGGTNNQYYHLTASNYNQVLDFINRGSMGIPGLDGIDGEDGMPGPQGNQGPTGATGATGATGPMGPQGMIGMDGEDGEMGMPIPGPQGPTGPASSYTSMVRVNTANGYGSTNNKIRRFTNVVVNTGTDITYTDSATLGGYFTINNNGMYGISYSDQFSIGSHIGVSLNTTTPTTSVLGIAANELICAQFVSGSNVAGNVAATIKLTAGDVIRAHGDGVAAGTSTSGTQFVIVRVN